MPLSVRLTLAITAVSLCACVPFAYVLPPIDASIDVGPHGGGKPVTTALNVDVGVRPLALFPELHHRDNDFSLGYSINVYPDLVHGPYGEFTHVFVELNPSSTTLWRFRAGGLARLLYDPSIARFGVQALARAVFESSVLVDEDFTSSTDRAVTMGHALGELGFGIYAEGGLRAVQPDLGWTLSIGLIFTLPASAGVGLAWTL